MSLPAVAHCQPQYDIIDLRQATGMHVEAADVNSHGWVGGLFQPLGGGNYQAGIYRNGTVELLGILPGEYVGSQIFGINDNGLGVGRSVNPIAPDPQQSSRATLFTPGGPVDMGWYGYANAINNSSQAVITTPFGTGTVFWDNGASSFLAGDGFAEVIGLDINDGGDVAGWGLIPGTGYRALKWVNGQLVNLHPAGAAQSRAFAMNDVGDVVGIILAPASYSGPVGPVVWKHDGTIVQLVNSPTFVNGTASDINNQGFAVGDFGEGGPSEAFLSQYGTFWRLRDIVEEQGWRFQGGGYRIGNGGHIIGPADYGDRNTSVLLVPVPEASNFTSLSLTFFGVMTLRRLAPRR